MNATPRKIRHGLIVACLLLLLTGCREELSSQYGQQDDKSVNGFDVLASMFREADNRVYTVRRRLTPRLREKADVLVWMPDNYAMPTFDEQMWLESWLEERGGRVLVYIGRDYDSAPEYWRRTLAVAPADKQAEFQRRLMEAEAEESARRSELPATAYCGWFIHTKDNLPWNATPPKKPKANQLSGEPQWVQGVDAAQLDLKFASHIDPPFEADVLLALDQEIVVSRQAFDADDGTQSELIVVSNASFLTNLALVNHQHRKLAASLVAEVGSERDVYFVESDARGLNLAEDTDPQESPGSQSGLEFLIAPRLSNTFLHLLALGIIFSFSCWPIFGRPRSEVSTHETDFGRHVEALGDLIEKRGDKAHAEKILQHYQQQVRDKSGGQRSAASR